jgi:uncharacterized membrane protein YeaQ/YmgE (transglycosylase-associated protein family)
LLWRSPANPALATQNSSTAFLTRGSFAKFTAIRRALAAWPGAASIKGKEHESCYFNGNHEAHDIIIGFVAGIIAKLIYPGNKYEPTGYIWTTVLGIIGAFVATYLGQAVGWYQPGESAGFIGAIVGAIIVLFVWGFIAPRFERT